MNMKTLSKILILGVLALCQACDNEEEYPLGRNLTSDEIQTYIVDKVMNCEEYTLTSPSRDSDAQTWQPRYQIDSYQIRRNEKGCTIQSGTSSQGKHSYEFHQNGSTTILSTQIALGFCGEFPSQSYFDRTVTENWAIDESTVIVGGASEDIPMRTYTALQFIAEDREATPFSEAKKVTYLEFFWSRSPEENPSGDGPVLQYKLKCKYDEKPLASSESSDDQG